MNFVKVKSSHAFTLVELSIVIVIIGLIIAGVTAGRSLVKQAQLNRVTTDLGKYKAAILAFKLQYNYLPGDIPNAYAYWGTAFGCTNAILNVDLGVGCNGNGNGKIEFGAYSRLGEGRLAWQQLSKVGLIEGAYNGSLNDGVTPWRCVPGLNVPSGPFGNGGYELTDQLLTTTGVTSGIIIASQTSNDTCWGALFIPREARSIDSKIDDGSPVLGKMHGANGQSGTACKSGNNYDLTQSGVHCYLDYIF